MKQTEKKGKKEKIETKKGKENLLKIKRNAIHIEEFNKNKLNKKDTETEKSKQRRLLLSFKTISNKLKNQMKEKPPKTLKDFHKIF